MVEVKLTDQQLKLVRASVTSFKESLENYRENFSFSRQEKAYELTEGIDECRKLLTSLDKLMKKYNIQPDYKVRIER